LKGQKEIDQKRSKSLGTRDESVYGTWGVATEKKRTFTSRQLNVKVKGVEGQAKGLAGGFKKRK